MKLLARTTVAVGIAGTLVLAAACGGDTSASRPVDGSWDDVVAAAEEEGSVHLYSTQHPENLEALKVAFTQEYPGIELDFTRGTDVETNPRVEAEVRTGKGTADVHMLSDPSWAQSAADSGTYSVDIVGPAFGNQDYDRDRSVMNGKLFLTSAAIMALGWNVNELPQGLQSPADLLDPALRGRIGVVNPSGFAAVVDEYQFFEKNWGNEQFNEQLAALEPRIYPGSLGIAQALSSGEIVATPMVQPLIREMEAGAPIDWIVPEQAWGTPWYSHVLTSAPHPNAAQVLANFLVTEKAQVALSKGYGSVLGDIPGAVGRAQDVGFPDIAALTPEAVDRYQQEWEKMFVG